MTVPESESELMSLDRAMSFGITASHETALLAMARLQVEVLRLRNEREFELQVEAQRMRSELQFERDCLDAARRNGQTLSAEKRLLRAKITRIQGVADGLAKLSIQYESDGEPLKAELYRIVERSLREALGGEL